MTIDVGGTPVPSLLYGTAWKEDATEGLVVQALEAGFRGVDTANQRKHYHEEGVGRAVARKLADGSLRREDLFLQSKFTFLDGQDHRLPYDPHASVTDQVAQSFESSLAHLGVERIDSLVLHGPSRREGLGPLDHEAWRAMEALVARGVVGVLGASNVTAGQVRELVQFAGVAPRFVQNRCYAVRGWDRAVRTLCAEHGIVYQGFSLLTANRQVLADASVQAIAARHRWSPAQVVLRFSQQIGMLPLTGTTNRAHMAQDLAIESLVLTAEELGAVEQAGQAGAR